MAKIFGSMAAIFVSLWISAPAQAAIPRAFSMGVNFLSQGMNKVSKDATGATSATGTMFYNLDFQYHWAISMSSMISPRLIWGPDFLLPHQENGSLVKTSFMILAIPWTYNMSSSFDIAVGPAIIDYKIKGPGGITTLNNGNSTSNFALPGRTETSRTLGVLLGLSYFASRHRFSLDSLTEGAASNTKRTYSFMLTYAYALTQF